MKRHYTVPNNDPTKTVAWSALLQLARQVRKDRIADYFDIDSLRVENYSISVEGLHVDFSKHLICDDVLNALIDLATVSPLIERRDAMFRGEVINTTEDRAVMHTSLRSPDAPLEVQRELERMKALCRQVRSGEWSGYSHQRITDVVNIGIGGSDLGPKMVCTALSEFAHPELNFHFVSNVDGASIRSILHHLEPESTLFIIASKSYTTMETMLNSETAVTWFRENTGLEEPLQSRHFIAVTASPDKALAKGISEQQIFTFQDWTGGRYSLWSSIGVSICLCIGPDRFEELLAGAHAMDQHFRTARLRENLPVLLGLTGIWHYNFLGHESTAIVPYCERLGMLPAFLQQLDMESNGKHTTLDGHSVNYHTGPVVWGQTGTNGQHAFFQLLHQGTRTVPIEFIGVIKDSLSDDRHHRVLLANMIAQSAALLAGEQNENPHRQCPGNRPSTTILLDELTPGNLGRLLALYEHRVFCQGAIWNINSFDQWGVELGKKLTGNVLDKKMTDQLDPSTLSLLEKTGL